jgi:hypothetical protein
MKATDKTTNVWQSLTAHARHTASTQPAEEVTAPLGFATRVVAQWKAAQENPTFAFWQRWSLRGAALACMTYALLATWSSLNPRPEAISVLDVPAMPNF